MTARTRVILLVHQLETHRPSNTARLLHHCLSRSELHATGGRDQPAPDPVLPAGCRPAVLFPADDAVPLDRWPGPLPDTLLVPDGTWNQASRMRRRLACLQGLPCVALPPPAILLPRLRSADRDGRLCTMAAVALALTMLEGDDAGEPLLHLLAMKVDRTRWMRGELRHEQVTGGIPDGAQRHVDAPRGPSRRTPPGAAPVL